MAVVRTVIIIVVLTLGWIAMRAETFANTTRSTPATLTASPVRPLSQGAP